MPRADFRSHTDEKKRVQRNKYDEGLAEAKTRLGTVIHAKFEAPGTFRKQVVTAFLDFENTCNFMKETNYDVRQLKFKINSALGKVPDEMFRIGEIIGFGSLNCFRPDQYVNLQASGFNLKHVLPTKIYCAGCRPPNVDPYQRPIDQADKWLVESMLVFALDLGSPTNILVISGDADFTTPITLLRSQGHRVFIALDKNEEFNDSLVESGEACYSWSQLRQATLKLVLSKREEQRQKTGASSSSSKQ